jgi:integrase
MTDNRSLLKLIPGQREELQRWAQSRTLPAGDVFRARLMLALADGTTYREIARTLKTSLPTIARWKMRFERDGLAGLEGRHHGSKPRAATPKVQARVIRRVQQKPEDGSTHWSCRKLASELGLSKSTVQQARDVIRLATEPYRSLFWIIAETGIRGGEVCGLFVEDMDLPRQFIHVKRSAWRAQLQTPKTGNAVRSFPISPALAVHLVAFIGDRTGLIFATRTGKPLDNYNVVTWILKPLLKQIGIEDTKYMGLHAFRHCNASALDSMGAPMRVRMDRLGPRTVRNDNGLYPCKCRRPQTDCRRAWGGFLPNLTG